MLHGKDRLKLGNLVHRIDKVDAFDAVQIPLMHAVHTQIAGQPSGAGLRRSPMLTLVGRVLSKEPRLV